MGSHVTDGGVGPRLAAAQVAGLSLTDPRHHGAGGSAVCGLLGRLPGNRSTEVLHDVGKIGETNAGGRLHPELGWRPAPGGHQEVGLVQAVFLREDVAIPRFRLHWEAVGKALEPIAERADGVQHPAKTGQVVAFRGKRLGDELDVGEMGPGGVVRLELEVGSDVQRLDLARGRPEVGAEGGIGGVSAGYAPPPNVLPGVPVGTLELETDLAPNAA